MLGKKTKVRRKYLRDKRRNEFENKISVVTQSPIDLITSESINLHLRKPLIFNGYINSDEEVILLNNGTTAYLSLPNGSNPPLISGGHLTSIYKFEQLHFHWSESNDTGTEHSIDGKKFAAEMHMVHFKDSFDNFEEASNQKDGLVVISFLLNVSSSLNESCSKLLNAVSQIPKQNQMIKIRQSDCFEWMLNNNLGDYFTYCGSLTTPPFLETVIWIVYKNPINISDVQMESLRLMNISIDGKTVKCNDRPLQQKPAGLNIFLCKNEYRII